jgi:hypothetical protein
MLQRVTRDVQDKGEFVLSVECTRNRLASLLGSLVLWGPRGSNDQSCVILLMSTSEPCTSKTPNCPQSAAEPEA